ncbi:MAG: sulfatase-like hydrolase/transferase [Oscillospiraceae bacterium]
MFNYTFIDKLAKRFTPMLRKWHTVPLLLVVIGLFVYFLARKLPTVTEALVTIVCIAFSALIVVNLVSAIPSGIAKLRHKTYTNAFDNIDITFKKDRPNIYCLLYDEYASFYQQEKYLGYKNEELPSFFADNNIVNSLSSANEANSTNIILSNLFMLDYVADYNTTYKELDTMRETGALHGILKKAGYTERGVGAYEWLGLNIDGNSKAVGQAVTLNGDSVWTLLFKPTCFANGGTLDMHNDDSKQAMENDFDELDNMEIKKDSSLFTFFYIMCPHPPYYFNADGETNMEAFAHTGDKNQNPYYIEQLKYTDTRIEKSVKRIIEQDSNSIIIIMSDHGFRFDDNTPYLERRRILNAVYYKGQDLDELEGKSTVNTFRLLLNKELNLNLDYKEVPNEMPS